MINPRLAPRANQKAWLSLDGDIEMLYPSRVENTDNDRVVIMAPLTNKDNSMLKSIESPDDGTTCSLLWPESEDGYIKRDCLVTDVRREVVEIWTLKMVGESTGVQRRAFARVPEDMQAQLHFSDRSSAATLLDMSEGGLSATIDSFRVGIEHLHVYADLVIAQQQVMIPSQLVHVEDHDNGRMNVGIQFMQIENIHADLMRKHVFSRQIDIYNQGGSDAR